MGKLEQILAAIPVLRTIVANDGSLGDISALQWIAVGAKALEAGPQVVAALAALHPALQTLADDLEKNKNPHSAASRVTDWCAGLQNLLNAAGDDPPVAVDGSYGPATAVAVRAFQQRRGLVVDGIAGPLTMAVLTQKGTVQ